MLHYPNVAPECGDTLVAEREDSWGHVADYHDEIQADDLRIHLWIGERKDLPHGNDTFEGMVNGAEADIHIDLVSELFQLADNITYER